ncbi:MAG: exodeoxyribonuclease VII large subunit [Planctomycetota bacterium]|jgi:exodeoxyribonuclease VII large subunit
MVTLTMARKPTNQNSQRSLFDPSRTRAAQSSPQGEEAMGVSQLCGLIDRAIRNNTPQQVRVRGELSNLTDRTHWYFTLKDESASISCVMFASQTKRVKFRPEIGQEVIATGRVEFYTPQGRTQLYVERLEPVGIGALEQALRQRIEELKARGYFELEHKSPLPRFPRRVVVITSATGAAWHDVRDTFARRAPWIELIRIDVRVQGENATPSIARALRDIRDNHVRLGIDACIVTRGGGSIEDLWAFNELEVAEAIFGCPIPVVCAIGHETDTTIAELVADERAATPTQAAMRLSPDRGALDEQLMSMSNRLSRTHERFVLKARDELDGWLGELSGALLERVTQHARSLETLGSRIERARPVSRIAHQRALLERQLRLLHTSLAHRVRAHKRGVASLEHALTIASPPSVLQRGYSITLDENGNVLTDASRVGARQALRTRLRSGVVWSTTTPPPSEKPQRIARSSHQFDLFAESE